MAIRFITGKPGDGKSMVATQQLVRSLVSGPRQVVTNVPILPGPLWDFIKLKYGKDVDLDRVTVINEDEVKKFFLHRGRGWVAPLPVERKEGGDGRIDYSNCTRTVTKLHSDGGPDRAEVEVSAVGKLAPVIYFIDEAHLHFGSRQWADTAQSALFYLSQHRHLGDEVFFITQHVGQVDKALRRLTQEFWRVTNYGNRFPFGVKLPDLFVVDVFSSEPSLMGAIVDTRSLRLDVEGLGSCYDTAGGLGMVGGLADTQGKRKGVPWQAAVIGLVVVLACMFLLPIGIGKAFGRALPTNYLPATATNGTFSASATNRPSTLPVLVKSATPPTFQPTPVVFNPNVVHTLSETNGSKLQAGPAIAESMPPKLKFYMRKNDVSVLGLDNGEVLSVMDGRLKVFGRILVVDGLRVFRLPE